MIEYTIEHNTTFGNSYIVYKWDIYPASSVLAGQNMKIFKEKYEFSSEGLAQAQEEFPTATIGYRDANNTYDHLPDENGYTSVSNGVCYHDYSPCGCYPED